MIMTMVGPPRGSGITARSARDSAGLEDQVHRWLLDEVGPDERLDFERVAAFVRAAEPLLASTEVERVVALVAARVAGWGPLEPLLHDPCVTEIMVNGPGPVWVERAGRLQQ